MAMVVKVRFKRASKYYDFDPLQFDVHTGMKVITETVRGVELGECVSGVLEIEDERLVLPLKPILRIATQEDIERQAQNEQNEKEALEIAQREVVSHHLDMKIVDVEYAFDYSKITFYFTADGRVDFRGLVKTLASIFRTRIELRQIGVRDEAKMLGGIGPCGRPICCRAFLGNFNPVSIKMAKEQNLSLNPTKISGLCDRLMCCLKYEQDNYEQTRKRMPKIGKEVETPDGIGVITDINVLSESVTVRIAVGDSFENRVYSMEDCVRPDQDKTGIENRDNRETKKEKKILEPQISEPCELEETVSFEEIEIPDISDIDDLEEEREEIADQEKQQKPAKKRRRKRRKKPKSADAIKNELDTSNEPPEDFQGNE